MSWQLSGTPWATGLVSIPLGRHTPPNGNALPLLNNRTLVIDFDSPSLQETLLPYALATPVSLVGVPDPLVRRSMLPNLVRRGAWYDFFFSVLSAFFSITTADQHVQRAAPGFTFVLDHARGDRHLETSARELNGMPHQSQSFWAVWATTPAGARAPSTR